MKMTFRAFATVLIFCITLCGLAQQQPEHDRESLRIVGGRFQFRLTGKPGVVHRIEVSTNLVNWEHVARIAPFSGSYVFMEDQPAKYRSAFYRAREEASETNEVRYVGTSLVIITNVPPGFGAGAIVNFNAGGFLS